MVNGQCFAYYRELPTTVEHAVTEACQLVDPPSPKAMARQTWVQMVVSSSTVMVSWVGMQDTKATNYGVLYQQ
jgi:hypothetical protein